MRTQGAGRARPGAEGRWAPDKDAARYDVSPVEIVAAFQVPLAGRRGALDQDRVIRGRRRARRASATGRSTRSSWTWRWRRGRCPSPSRRSTCCSRWSATESGRAGGGGRQPLRPRAVREPAAARRDAHRAGALGEGGHPQGHRRHLRLQADAGAARRTTSPARPRRSPNFEQLVSLSGTQELDASRQAHRPGGGLPAALRLRQPRLGHPHRAQARQQPWCACASTACCTRSTRCPAGVHAPIVSRVKMLSRIDISEKRKPQDGRIKTERDGREVELRVSTLPTAFGEKVVIRIFDPETLVQDIAQLGFDAGREGGSSSRGSTSRTGSSWSPAPPAAARRPRSTRRSRRWPGRT